MNHSLMLQPLIPLIWFYTLVGLAFIVVMMGVVLRRRGALLRLLALATLALAIANPVMVEEQREPVKSTVGVVIDRSLSQKLGERQQDTDSALAALKTMLAKYPQFETRIIEAGMTTDKNSGTATNLFAALNQAIGDVPPALYAGTILITDGQVHDVAASQNNTSGEKPVNALLTGRPGEFDRQIKFVEPPRFGLTNKPLSLSILVEDKGQASADTDRADVVVTVNGERIGSYSVTPGKAYQVDITLPHAGKNIIEASTLPMEGELTEVNNQTVAMIDGIRENLRVLLVSGEPHNGERTWRDLLKSDASIDLVHFTILRPPEKADNTPLSQLSLIVFPTTELFVDKINDFDLVIFDRYQHYDVLPLIYYDYVAQYVQNGGALLMATGPEFTGQTSLARTPLISALPALPTGEVIEKPFRPTLTEQGKRHPVTRGLDTNGTTAENWGRWMRQIAIRDSKNSTAVMNGADNKPLMLLSHVGKGRVGMLLSDEGWLWARGFEGGGPYAALYRRMAHWLMKEPELEEEALTASGDGQTLTIRRQTMADKPEQAEVSFPSGKKEAVSLIKEQEGVFVASVPTDEVGLFKVTNGDKTALAHIGPVNAPEYAELISTSEKLLPTVISSGGAIARLHADKKDGIKLPNIQINKQSSTKSSAQNTAMILNEADQTRLVNTAQFPIFSGILALIACLIFMGSMWYREGH